MYNAMKNSVFLIINVAIFYSLEIAGDLQSDIDIQLNKANFTKLSRSRRYLVFPPGSSFQLVFDLAYPTLDSLGFFVYGNTAALAWELPSTPVFLDKKFMKKEEEPTTTTPLPHLEHPDYDWHSPQTWTEDEHPPPPPPQPESGWKSKVGYDYSAQKNNNRWPVSSYYNPFGNYLKKGYSNYQTSSKYPVYQLTNNNARGHNNYRSDSKQYWSRTYENSRRNNMRISRVEPYRNRAENWKEMGMSKELYHNVHRRTRRDLYSKIEELFAAVTSNGRSCFFKLICQVNQSPKQKGTFFEELLKTIFIVKPDGFQEDEDHYDAAADLSHNCEDMYPDCKGNVFSHLLSSVLTNKRTASS